MENSGSFLDALCACSDEPGKLEQINEHYRYEDLLMESVVYPDPEKCAQALKGLELTYYRNVFPPRFPNDPAREYQDSTLRLNTVLRVAARQGGLPPVFLHAISDGFAFQIYGLNTIRELKSLRRSMALYYVEAVNEYSVKKYSPDMGKVVTYINYHLLDPLSLAEIADHFHYSVSHLSRRFKKETGRALSTFVVERRIKLATQYFRMGYTGVTQVSQMCGFRDSGYFHKMFKKIEGVTPSMFMEQHRTKRH